MPLCGNENRPPAGWVSNRAQTPVAIRLAGGERDVDRLEVGAPQQQERRDRDGEPDSACQPFMSEPSTSSALAASPTPKSGLTIRPGMLHIRISPDPINAAHWTGSSLVTLT